MSNQSIKKVICDLMQLAGVHVNGGADWDIQVHNEAFYSRVFHKGSLGLGESYMEGGWDCKNVDQLIDRIVSADLENKVKSDIWLLPKLLFLKLINHQTQQKSLEVGLRHYDLGNDLFKAMLDSRMNYTCGYWPGAKNLDEAQENKLELSCKKLMLEPGMKVLDIGCGFGAFAKYAAENYGVSVVGVTISKEQCEYAKQNCAGLPVEIRFQDYREVNERFDRIVSLGMFEHVGYLNYRTYMQKAHDCLKENGLFLLHTIGKNDGSLLCDPWITKYIFPNGMIPSMSHIGKASEGLLTMENWSNYGVNYDKTLMAWHDNFEAHWEQLKSHYDERFYRMWRYYLLACAGAFRARSLQLWQIVLSSPGYRQGYSVPCCQTEEETQLAIGF